MIDEKCRCDCHRNQNGMETRHVGPCCLKCHFCSINIPVSSVGEHKKRCAWAKMSVFSTELDYFEQHRMEWYKDHAGQFALIKKTTLYGFFDTDELALSAGYSIHGLDLDDPAPFMIKEVQLKDKGIFMHDRVVIDLFKDLQDDYVI